MVVLEQDLGGNCADVANINHGDSGVRPHGGLHDPVRSDATGELHGHALHERMWVQDGVVQPAGGDVAVVDDVPAAESAGRVVCGRVDRQLHNAVDTGLYGCVDEFVLNFDLIFGRRGQHEQAGDSLHEVTDVLVVTNVANYDLHVVAAQFLCRFGTVREGLHRDISRGQYLHQWCADLTCGTDNPDHGIPFVAVAACHGLVRRMRTACSG